MNYKYIIILITVVLITAICVILLVRKLGSKTKNTKNIVPNSLIPLKQNTPWFGFYNSGVQIYKSDPFKITEILKTTNGIEIIWLDTWSPKTMDHYESAFEYLSKSLVIHTERHHKLECLWI